LSGKTRKAGGSTVETGRIHPGKGTWLSRWEPDDEQFWRAVGSRVAWRTLVVTTATLVLSFATRFAMSAIVVRLPEVGVQYSTMQLFWLAAMPGLAGGTLRILHTFLVPIFGTRHVVTVATLLKVLPCVGIGLAVFYGLNTVVNWWFYQRSGAERPC
jgi:MFS transporter, NNP family, nitrate/nitrite transporter